MSVSYKKLWKLLIDRNIKKKDLQEIKICVLQPESAILPWPN